MSEFIPKKKKKEVISMRIPLDVLERIDNIANETGLSRNELLNQSIAYALEHLKFQKKDDEK